MGRKYKYFRKIDKKFRQVLSVFKIYFVITQPMKKNSHPNYNQLYGKFNPFACILDLFMNEGENSMKIIRSGRKKTQKLF